MNEKTLVILKPNAITNNHVGEIISRFERRNIKISKMKMTTLSEDIIKIHYSHLLSKSFFNELCTYMTSNPVIILELSGENVIASVRQMIGATDPLKASPGTIRADFATTSGENIIHASDSNSAASKEISLFFD